MTYCFAFKANPDGVAIISDTRLTVEEPNELKVIEGEFLKVLSPHRNVIIALSGVVGQLNTLLDALEFQLREVAFSKLFEEFQNLISTRYLQMWRAGEFSSDSFPSMSIIYADIRKRRSATKTRLAKFVLTIRNNKIAIERSTGKGMEWGAIGWTPEGRKYLSGAAVEAIGELESRSLIISRKFEHDLQKEVIYFDSSGVRDASFRKTLRDFSRNQRNQLPSNVVFDPMMIFGATALKAVESGMNDARNEGMPLHDCVGDKWTLTTLTLESGVRTYSDQELTPLFNNVLY